MRAAAVRAHVDSILNHRIPSALVPVPRSLPEMISTGIAELDEHTGGGVPRGALSELCGPASSGRTTVLYSLIAQATGKNQVCALVDATDTFSPDAATAAGVKLKHLLWIRCGRSMPNAKSKCWPILDQALRVVDLLLHGGGFNLVALDLGNIPAESANRISLTSWFRFRRAVENTQTAFIVLEQRPHACSCASLVIDLESSGTNWASMHSASVHSSGTILKELSFTANFRQRKPTATAHRSTFQAITLRAG